MTMMLHCRSHEYKNVKFLTAVSKLYLHIFQHLFVFKLSDRCEGGPNSVHCNIVTEATLSEPNSGTFSQLKIPVFKVPSPSTFEYISKLLRGRFELVEKFIAKLVHNFCSRFIWYHTSNWEIFWKFEKNKIINIFRSECQHCISYSSRLDLAMFEIYGKLLRIYANSLVVILISVITKEKHHYWSLAYERNVFWIRVAHWVWWENVERMLRK